MAHLEQQNFCKKILNSYPEFFINSKVLDIGSLDINGNNRYLLTTCNYIGLDLGIGPNVDVVGVAHEYDAPTNHFDLIISTEVFEHDMYYKDSIKNIIRMIKPGGAFLFTCASTAREEHGTRRSDGGGSAPLLGQQSEEWSDYYKNLTIEDFYNDIFEFREAFPDGIFEYSPDMRDIYFFGIKGGISNYLKYKPKAADIVYTSNGDDIFVVDTWPDSLDKELELIKCINNLRSFSNIPILLVSHYPIKPEIQKLVDYYIFDADNPILVSSEFEKYSVFSGRWTCFEDYRIDNYHKFHHDYAIWKSMTIAFKFCKNLGKTNIHFMEYDCIVDPFQYRQAFLEKLPNYDAIIYEYSEKSSRDIGLGSYIATYIFSIKTDIAIRVINSVKSKEEYFSNRPNGWQLERVFYYYLKLYTDSIHVSEYIANSNELNTKAVWNRDGIDRDGARFQLYPAVDKFGNLYLHTMSGFHEVKATSDYLLEISYAGISKFHNLKVDALDLIRLGEYKKGYTIYVKYLGKTIYSEYLSDEVNDFFNLNHVEFNSYDTDDVAILYHFADGAHAEILSKTLSKYTIDFIDGDTNSIVYSTKIGYGEWARTSIKYFKNWIISVKDLFNNEVEYIKYDASNKRVYISIDSIALGDTLAWIPYVDEFRKKHKCEVICSTFWNDLFIKKYKKITFVKPGEQVDNVYAMYRIGHHYDGEIFDNNMNPTNFVNRPLQQTASDILGLPFSEIKPKIVSQPHTPDKLIGLGIQSTAQSKYWNNSTGWQEVVDWIKSIGYTPIILSREENGYMGNFYPSEVYQNPSGPLGNVISLLARCSAFVGVSSGLSWLAWAVGVPVVQVSGVTYSFNEPNSGFTKINTPNGLCSGCANRVKFDPGNWTWCPEHEHDSRIFECSREIPASDVISALSNLLQIDNIK